MSENQSLDKMTEFSLIGWIVSVVFFLFVATPMAIILYLSVSIIYAIKQSTQFLKKTIKNAKAKFKPVATKSLS
jgi:membrane protein insertase Oxa1/YidC/SpoIIIJ